MTCEFTWHQIKHQAQEVCNFRNENCPSEVGKVLLDCAAERFMFQIGVLPVDALHFTQVIDVAKIESDEKSQTWQLFYIDAQGQWLIYPVARLCEKQTSLPPALQNACKQLSSPSCTDKTKAQALLEILRIDPLNLIWEANH